jgi:hypothetical protein
MISWPLAVKGREKVIIWWFQSNKRILSFTKSNQRIIFIIPIHLLTAERRQLRKYL